jgi:PAS domain S-box-containing protein
LHGVHPDDRAQAIERLESALAHRQEFEAEYRLRRHDGEYRWVCDTGAPVVSPDGVFFGFVGSCVDITDRLWAEEAAKRREREFKRLAESIPDVIARLDRKLRYLYVNPAISSVLGREPTEFIGRENASLNLPEAIETPYLEAVRATFAEDREHQFRFDVGSGEALRHYEGRVIPEHSQDSGPDTVLVITYDVTLRTQHDRQRSALLAREQAARAQAETATLARDQFLAIVSHELRSPLNGIKSWSHVLENQLKDARPPVKRALAGIRIGVDQQVRLIEDLLDATRVMSGNLGLAKQAVALRPLIEGAVEGLRASAQERKLEIALDLDIDAHQVDGDPDRIQQVLRNLVSNAIKFAAGRIRIAANSDARMICITVEDDGVGIDPGFLPYVFDAFRQAANNVSLRGQEGLGLGLLLVRRLVELHGGQVSVESAGKDRGSKFRILLPLRPTSSPARTLIESPRNPVTSLPSLSGLRILLVDDQEDAREAVAALLTQSGACVFAMPSGREARTCLDACDERDYPDVLVCDIAMPGEDGYETLKRIRTWENTNPRRGGERLPAIALTAFAEPADRLRALTEGFQMHVSKPVAPAELIVVIASVARGMQL